MDDLPLFKWRAPAKLAIFPPTRNVAKLQRIAIAAASVKNPENIIRAAVERTRSSYSRKGLPADLVEKEVAELEVALRDQVEMFLAKRGVAK